MLLKEETSDVKVKLQLNDLLLNEESLVLLSYCCFKTYPVPGSQEVGTQKLESLLENEISCGIPRVLLRCPVSLFRCFHYFRPE